MQELQAVVPEAAKLLEIWRNFPWDWGSGYGLSQAQSPAFQSIQNGFRSDCEGKASNLIEMLLQG